jgi:serine/threonine-protein kinase RsbW/sigma-B regulation protein RsbU (phosphoserine phosphatase)
MTAQEPRCALSLTLPGEAAGGDAGKERVLVDAEFPSRLDDMEAFLDEASSRLPAEAAFAVRLCLEELIVNVITHGLGNDPGHVIRVRMAITPAADWLEVRLKDDAPAFDPFTHVPRPDLTLGVDERSVGGLGVHFVMRTMDECRWHYVDGGNLIVLRKRLARATGADDPPRR